MLRHLPLLMSLSLLLNVAVLVPVCAGLTWNQQWVGHAYGPATPARGILLSVYLAIAIASLALLFYGNPDMVASLLAVQVLYKVTTPISTRSRRNPVVLSNLAIAGFHAITLTTTYGLA